MSLFILILVGVVSIFVLVLSADYVVKKMIALAHYFGVSDTFVGLTVVSIGTSLPEIGSHLAASFGILSGNLDYEIASATVLGANIGSDVVQQTFILGLVILIIGEMTFSKSFLKKGYSLMIGAHLLVFLLAFWDGTISRWDGLLMVGIFVYYIYFLYEHDHHHKPDHHSVKHPLWMEIGLALGGMVLLLGSGTAALEVTEQVVRATGLGGSLIGVFSIGLASALPELTTAIEGAKKHAMGISAGTLIGSNITNPLLGIGLGGLISEYFVPDPILHWDLPMVIVTAGLLLIYLLTHKRKLGRWGGVYLIALYVVYAVVRIVFFSMD